MKSLNITYLPGIDHLRGYAATLIVLYHGFHLISYEERFHRAIDFTTLEPMRAVHPFHALLIEGHTAVSLFMVLSGFIFSYGLLGRRISYQGFIRNRVLRIYPLFLTLIFAGIYIYPSQFSLLGLVQTVFCLSNLSGALDLGPLSALFWTIAVEFQFYLVFPFLLSFIEKGGAKYAWSVILLLTILRIFGYLAGANIRDLSYWTIVGRMDQFIVGILAARFFLTHRDKENLLRMLFIPALAGVILLLYAFNLGGGWLEIHVWKAFWPTFEAIAWAVCLVSYLSFASWLPERVSRILAKLGEVSYSMYLLHYAVIHFSVKMKWYVDFGLGHYRNAITNTVLFILPAVILLSTLSYKTIELPFLRARKSYISG